MSIYKLKHGNKTIQEYTQRPCLEDILRAIWGYLDVEYGYRWVDYSVQPIRAYNELQAYFIDPFSIMIVLIEEKKYE